MDYTTSCGNKLILRVFLYYWGRHAYSIGVGNITKVEVVVCQWRIQDLKKRGARPNAHEAREKILATPPKASTTPPPN